MIEDFGGDTGAPPGDADVYVRGVREMVAQRRAQLEQLEAALASYERSAADEEDARKHVRGAVDMPWA